MTILVTGAAGFIGFHVSQALLARGETVIGIDNLNDYYDPALKQARLDQLLPHQNFTFQKVDIADRGCVEQLFAGNSFTHIVHLAAQAGVRYSIDNPHAYIQSNIVGHLNMLEGARHSRGLKHFVYASSSSVYGGNEKQPFSIQDRVDHPVSLYAATKKADELMSHVYAGLYQFPLTGLRFFTVYGPWGRPDMAYYKFTDKIMKGEPIDVYNHGNMMRDFTYIDDVVAGVLAAIDNPTPETHKIYNLGNNRAEKLMDFITEIEKALNKKAVINMMEMQPGDVVETYADITESIADLNYQPKTPISEGIPKFVEWFREPQNI